MLVKNIPQAETYVLLFQNRCQIIEIKHYIKHYIKHVRKTKSIPRVIIELGKEGHSSC